MKKVDAKKWMQRELETFKMIWLLIDVNHFANQLWNVKISLLEEVMELILECVNSIVQLAPI